MMSYKLHSLHFGNDAVLHRLKWYIMLSKKIPQNTNFTHIYSKVVYLMLNT